MRTIKVGKTYKHFKGAVVKIIAISRHTETDEMLVIYKHLETDEVWARPYEMFIGEVDNKKYPNVEQKYRFEECTKN